MNILICEICNTPIAKFEKITYPIRPEQFISYDSIHNPNNPFPKGLDWDYMKCPECQNRPFLLRTRVKTDKGFYIIKMPDGGDIEDDLNLWSRMESELDETIQRIEKDTPNPLKCKVCGKICKSALGLLSHMGSHKNG